MRTFRAAPSPTGHLHLGNGKAYIINYALSRAYNGRFILRIEDTDNNRNRMDTVDNIIKDTEWLGVRYDAGPKIGEKNEYFQSERMPLYQKHIDQLLQEGKAYKAYETPEERAMQIEEQRKKGGSPVYSGAHANLTAEEQQAFEAEGRKPVIRLKVPKDTIVEFEDKVFGTVKVNTNTIGDLVIQKSDGTPMYNFCVVIDDHDMNVTDVVRGFGHLSNTAKQVLIYQIFGWDIPTFAHFSDILNEDGIGKLSKRKGAKPLTFYRADGYLPEAIYNYVTVISCSFSFSSKEEEIMTPDQIFSSISYDKILHTNARIDPKKIDWFNGQHIRKLSPDELYDRVIAWLENDARTIKDFDENFDEGLIDLFLENTDVLRQALPLVHQRINKLSDIFGQLKFLFKEPDVASIDVTSSNHTLEEFVTASQKIYNGFQSIIPNPDQPTWEQTVRSIGDALGWKHGDVFMVLRLLVVGDKFSPPLYESMQLLGWDECVSRIDRYLKKHG